MSLHFGRYDVVLTIMLVRYSNKQYLFVECLVHYVCQNEHDFYELFDIYSVTVDDSRLGEKLAKEVGKNKLFVKVHYKLHSLSAFIL